jgi:hypothetical protein
MMKLDLELVDEIDDVVEPATGTGAEQLLAMAMVRRVLLKDWVLPASMERARRKLACADDGNRQMVDILTVVLTDEPAVEAACAEAIAHGVHSADVILNILARQRDPGPPATILTSAALTLRHAPIADCARYDNLRRTN